MSTLKQTEANRSNSQHSTGPRTTAGKAASARNAQTHGLLASDLTVLFEPASREAAAALLQQYNDYYRPTSPIQRALLRQIVILQHRLETAPALESGIYTEAAYSRYNDFMEEAKAFEPELRRSWRNQALAAIFVDDCKASNAISKLARYETALSNRLIKCLDRFDRCRNSDNDRPGDDETLAPYADSSPIADLLPDPRPEFPNEPNFDLTPAPSTAPEAPPDPPPGPNPAQTPANPPAQPLSSPENDSTPPRRPAEPSTPAESGPEKRRPA